MGAWKKDQLGGYSEKPGESRAGRIGISSSQTGPVLLSIGTSLTLKGHMSAAQLTHLHQRHQSHVWPVFSRTPSSPSLSTIPHAFSCKRLERGFLLSLCCESQQTSISLLSQGKLWHVPGLAWRVSIPNPIQGLVSLSNNKEIKEQIPSNIPQSLNHDLYIQRAKSCQHLHPTPRSSNPET